ncbi:hypothetical protein MASR2M44_01530 [Bacteroidota bacterium]
MDEVTWMKNDTNCDLFEFASNPSPAISMAFISWTIEMMGHLLFAVYRLILALLHPQVTK